MAYSQNTVAADNLASSEPAAAHQMPTEQLPTNNELEADDDLDSALGDNDAQSETASRKNPLFRSPLGENAQNVLDLGTGQGDWAIAVADKFPNLTVHGVDLYPPPHKWVPPNCILEVDDIGKEWSYKKTWDLVHLRIMMGSFDEAGWVNLYRQAYNRLAPGGWIEHIENDIGIFCDDGSMPSDSLFAEENYRSMFLRCAAKAGKELDTTDHLHRRIEAAGFTNIQSQDYKMPLGNWPKHRIYKDAGEVNLVQMKTGLDGWLMWLMTNFGDPEPWSVEEVTVFAAKLRRELQKGYHIYNKSRRVWAQKPYETADKTK